MLRRPLSYAIVDEVDSVLIDNCRNPQLISAPPIDVQEERQLANIVRLQQPWHCMRGCKRSMHLVSSSLAEHRSTCIA